MNYTNRLNLAFPSEGAENWFSAFQALMSSIDAYLFSGVEDRNSLILGDASFDWVASTGTLTWDDEFMVLTPTTGTAQVVSAGSETLLEGQMLVVDLVRGSSVNASLTPRKVMQLVADDSALLIAIRLNNKVYFRTGISLSDGEDYTVFNAPKVS